MIPSPLKDPSHKSCMGPNSRKTLGMFKRHIKLYFETHFLENASTLSSSVARMKDRALIFGLETRQVDYANAFVQAELDEEIYVEIPRGFGSAEGGNMVMKLNHSLYSLKQAPLKFLPFVRAVGEVRIHATKGD